MTAAQGTDAHVALMDEYHRRQLDRLSDVQLIRQVAAAVAVPRADPADSFILHAPLELVARAALLPHVGPNRRTLARLRLVSLAAGFEAFGSPVVEPTPDSYDSVLDATGRLAAAIESGDLDDVDATARWIGRVASPDELRAALAADIVPRLSAAAHGSIFLYQLPRVSPRGEITGELLRQLAREVARNPEWRLHWIDEPRPAGSVAAQPFTDAIARAPFDGPPASSFIFPLMSHVDTTGCASEHLTNVTGGPDITERGRALLRIAAWSMLLEPDDHAPYGWSHCLSMPQAVLGISGALRDPSTALAVAATYVVGFRTALALVPLEPVFPWGDPRIDPTEAFDGGSNIAAGAVWHAPESELAYLTCEIVTRAATSHDAHLVKYTLACLDAASADPDHRRLFLSAAASLVGWWAERGDPSDPLG